MSELTFSIHARDRIRERTSLTTEEVAQLLSTNRSYYVPIKLEDEKVHKLFYSERDRRYFVVVQDTKDNTVVTVMAESFYDHFEIPREAFRWAKTLNPPNLFSENGSGDFDVYFTVATPDSGFIRHNLGSWCSRKWNSDPRRFLKDNQIQKEIAEKVTTIKESNFGDDHPCHSIRIEKNGDKVLEVDISE